MLSNIWQINCRRHDLFGDEGDVKQRLQQGVRTCG